MAVSFKTDILPLFNATDIQHMSGMGVQLSSYTYMSNPAAGSVMGKRYVDAESGLEALCTKPGAGSLSLDGRPLAVKATKKLPSSD